MSYTYKKIVKNLLLVLIKSVAVRDTDIFDWVTVSHIIGYKFE